jgi:hypothetical protein
MKYLHGTPIKSIERRDKEILVEIVARDDGFFQFFQYTAYSDDHGFCWMPGKLSGLYALADVAEADARAEFDL